MNVEQIFPLIDNLIPLEICSHHRILPLMVKNQSLLLGMVNPDDLSVLDYVRPIIKTKSYFVKRQEIHLEDYQRILREYRDYNKRDQDHTAILSEEEIFRELEALGVIEASDPPEMVDSTETTDLQPPPTLTHLPQDEPPGEFSQGPEMPLVDLDLSEYGELPAPSLNPTITPQESVSPRSLSLETWPILDLQPRYLSVPFHLLSKLPPEYLMTELLARLLMQDYGQIYFQCSALREAEIICNPKGKNKQVLSQLTAGQIHRILTQLKQLFLIPPRGKKTMRKIEMMRAYQGESLLLRFQFSLGEYGEQASVEFFKNRALVRYQQKQMEQFSQDAIALAQQLQAKLKKISDRRKINTQPLDQLPRLRALLKTIDHQCQALDQESDRSPQGKS